MNASFSPEMSTSQWFLWACMFIVNWRSTRLVGSDFKPKQMVQVRDDVEVFDEIGQSTETLRGLEKLEIVSLSIGGSFLESIASPMSESLVQLMKVAESCCQGGSDWTISGRLASCDLPEIAENEEEEEDAAEGNTEDSWGVLTRCASMSPAVSGFVVFANRVYLGDCSHCLWCVGGAISIIKLLWWKSANLVNWIRRVVLTKGGQRG